MYRCISDRYDPDSGHYDSLDDFLAMCRACFGSAPELHRDGESYRDDQGLVLEPAPEMVEHHRRSEIAAAEPSASIGAATTTDDITRALDIDYDVTPEGAIRCQLSGNRSLLLYQHEQQDGADIAGLWAYCETDAAGEQCSGGLDSFDELPGLLA